MTVRARLALWDDDRVPRLRVVGSFRLVDDGADDSYMNETVYESETLKEAVIAPVQTYGNDNANAAI